MKKLLFIDACIRGNVSRTKRIATPIIAELSKKYEIETLTINELNLEIVDDKLVEKRTSGIITPHVLKWAESIRDADRIVIAAPFWDMSFPAALKVFVELCSIFNVTFRVDETKCIGNCKSEKFLYITTRGMNIKTGDPLDQGTSYFKALSFLWGLGEMIVVSAENIDYSSEAIIEEKIAKAIEEGLSIAKDF